MPEVGMAVKTITIDIEAYELLSNAREGNESFSKIIKHILGSEGKNAQSLLANLDSLYASPLFLDTLERVVAARNEDVLSAEPFDTCKG